MMSIHCDEFHLASDHDYSLQSNDIENVANNDSPVSPCFLCPTFATGPGTSQFNGEWLKTPHLQADQTLVASPENENENEKDKDSFRTIVDPDDETFLLDAPPGFPSRPLKDRAFLRPRAHIPVANSCPVQPHAMGFTVPVSSKEFVHRSVPGVEDLSAWNHALFNTFGTLVHGEQMGPVKVRMKLSGMSMFTTEDPLLYGQACSCDYQSRDEDKDGLVGHPVPSLSMNAISDTANQNMLSLSQSSSFATPETQCHLLSTSLDGFRSPPRHSDWNHSVQGGHRIPLFPLD